MAKTEKVPSDMREKFDEITQITDDFSEKFLNDEYAEVIRKATAALCRKKNSPLKKGKPLAWACGITHAIGFVNFLADKSEDPYISAADLYKNFGVGQSTGQGKSKIVRDLLDMFQMAPEWTIPSKVATNPMTWMLEVNGMIVDARHAPRDLQVVAYEKGLIPFIPADKETA